MTSVLATFVAATLCFSLLLTGEAASTFCVVPSEKTSTDLEVKKHQQCKTWNEYLADQQRYFYGVSDVTFIFYPGTHFMNRSLEANGTNNLLITGMSSSDVLLTPTIAELSTPLKFNDFLSVTVEGMTITLCTLQNGLLSFSHGTNASVLKVNINNTCGGCEIYAESIENMTIANLYVKKANNNRFGSICFNFGMSGTIQIFNSSFKQEDPHNDYGFLRLGALSPNSLVIIISCNFLCGNVLGVDAPNGTVFLKNVHADGCAKSTLGACSITGAYNALYVVDSAFYRFQNVIMGKHLIFVINNTIFDTNLDLVIDDYEILFGSVLDFSLSAGSLYNVTFTQNGIDNTMFNVPDSPTVAVYSCSVKFINCTFSNNMGHALYANNSKISFIDYIYFKENRGYEGAAIYLDGESIIDYSQGIIEFQSNLAYFTGGAIFIKTQTHHRCPFNSSFRGRLIFSANFANSGGNDIYGGNLDQVAVNHDTRCIQVVRESSELPSDISAISSEPSRICLCNDNKPSCLQVFDLRNAYPGEDITVSLVAVGQTFGTSAGFVNAQILLSNQSLGAYYLDPEQQYQVVQPHSCNSITYTVYCVNGPSYLVILVLTTQIKLTKSYGSESDVNYYITEYNENHHSYVPKHLLEFPVYINITLKPCPAGFQLSAGAPRHICTCFPRLLEIERVKCHISRKELERSGTVWIGNNGIYINDSSITVLFSKYCPYNYCNPATVNVFNSFAAQCQWGYTGRLCGECPKGMSLTLGASKCRQCSNNYLGLLAVFAVGGVALVTFLKVTDLTTAGGLINGLILYANLVKAGSYIYFPYSSSSTYLQPFQVFIDWLNLDLGIEVCFFDGLDGYWKTWLQFVFPLYLWAISLTMILLARYSFRMARLLGNNSVPVLATLFTLSYAKIFRVIITAMKFTVLEDMHGHKFAVWSYDGSINYFNMEHSILFIAAALVLLFLWLPYTCVLLFAQCLQRCRVQKISRLVSKMQPLLDAHCGPFKDKHRYWFGLLLVVRAVPLLVGVLSSTNSDQNTVLSTIIVVGLLFLLQSRVYRKLYVSLSESSLLLNLLFLAGSALYTQSTGSSQTNFTAVLTGIAFLHFVAIVVFSTACHLRMVCYRRKWIPLHGTNLNTSDLYSRSYERNPPDCDRVND